MSSAIRLFADRQFYVNRPEPEEVFEGYLRAAPVITGPDTRDMPIHIELPDETLPVYALDASAELLRPLVDRRVRMLGKRVDLGPEGGVIELWPASVTPASR